MRSKSTLLLKFEQARMRVKRRQLPRMKIKMSQVLANARLKPSANVTFQAHMEEFKVPRKFSGKC